MKRVPSSKNILIIGGHDPCGGAGIQADIETVAALGAHACSLITCHTVQNTQSMRAQYLADAIIFREQAHTLVNDINFSAIKVGAVSSVAVLNEIIFLVKQLPNIPVVLDPVIAASHGIEFNDQTLLKIMFDELLPLTTVITPNQKELKKFAELSQTDNAILGILNTGCDAILQTNTDSNSNKIIEHFLYRQSKQTTFQCKRMDGHFHGSGCTLSSAIATYLSIDSDLPNAISNAIDYTVQSIQEAKHPGQGQAIPKRIL